MRCGKVKNIGLNKLVSKGKFSSFNSDTQISSDLGIGVPDSQVARISVSGVTHQPPRVLGILQKPTCTENQHFMRRDLINLMHKELKTNICVEN